jgi:predicted transglutaminase-like cysteine proteinase
MMLGANVAAGSDYPWATPPLSDARAMTTWADTLVRHSRQRSELTACVLDAERCEGTRRSVAHLIRRAGELDLEDQVRLVHRYVNHRRYRDDRALRVAGETDGVEVVYRNRWATLDEFVTRGGDCEDYASAKYFLLRELGVPADRLRVVVTFERRERNHHALLAVRFDSGEVWLLDSDNSIDRAPHGAYRFVYALNEASVWDHETAGG